MRQKYGKDLAEQLKGGVIMDVTTPAGSPARAMAGSGQRACARGTGTHAKTGGQGKKSLTFCRRADTIERGHGGVSKWS